MTPFLNYGVLQNTSTVTT